MTQEEWDEYMRLRDQFLEYQRALEVKYDKHINLILEDFLKDKYKD